MLGSVDGVHRGYTRGWAFDPGAPTSRLIVRMVDATGAVIARGLADRYRADVHKAGHGDGHYGFALPVSDPRVLGTARFLCGPLGAELPRPGHGNGGAGARIFAHAGLMIRLDQPPGSAALSGWAIDRANPAERRVIRLRAERQTIAEQRATLFRPDSIEAGSDGFHGFSLALVRQTAPLFLDDLASGREFRIA